MIIKTIAKQTHEELKKEMPEIYPQRYQGYKVNSVNYSVVISDIETYWNTEARFREGFNGDDENKVVTIPNFFTKVNGMYKNKADYIKFVKMLRESSNTITLDRKYDSSDIIETTDAFMEQREATFDKTNFKREYLDSSIHSYAVAPTIQNVLSGKIYCFRIKNSNDFTFEYLTSDKKQLVLDTMTRILMDEKNPLNLRTLFNYTEFISMVLTLDEEYINMLNNFDYGLEVPKIVVSKAEVTRTTAMFLYFMNELGLDIIVLSPSGKSNLEKYYDINNISLGYFDVEFNFDKEIVLEVDKEKIKEEKKEEIKEKRSQFISDLSFPWCVWAPLALIITAIGEILGWRGWVNTLIQFIGLLVVILVECMICDDDFRDEFSSLLKNLYGITIGALVAILCIRGYYALYIVETNPQANTYYQEGFKNIEEEPVTVDGFTIHQRDEGVIRRSNYNRLYYYIENNAENQFDIVFEIWIKNNIIYRSKTMKPLTYAEYVYLDSYLPEGDTVLTVKYYKAEGYNARSIDNEVIGEKSFVVHVLTEEQDTELEDSKEGDSVEIYGYELQ